MILYINTAQRDFLQFALISKTDVFLLKKNVGRKQSENMLLQLNNLLEKNKFKLEDLKKIVVNRGPGSFTSVRMGVVLANTMSYALKIPVWGIRGDEYELEKREDFLQLNQIKFKKGGFTIPYYDRDPNITKSKKKSFVKK
jgi:hypothetical protein